MRAYVLVNAKPGKVRDITRHISEMLGLRMANTCWSVPNIFEVANADELNKLVIDKIQSIEGVETAETHIAIG